MVTYKIIEYVQGLRLGFSFGNVNVSSLFYMDDALLLATSPQDASTIINKISLVSSRYGLELNRGKCQVMIYNKSSDLKDICVHEDGMVKFENIELVSREGEVLRRTY